MDTVLSVAMWAIGISALIIGLVYGTFRIGRAMWPIVLLCLFLLFLNSGCSTYQPYVEVGAGKNVSLGAEKYKWEDGGAGPLGAKISAGIEGDVRNNEGRARAGCAWTHFSQWFVGPPFNNKAESSLDHFGCSLKVYLGGNK